jgi:hypothetical protein
MPAKGIQALPSNLVGTRLPAALTTQSEPFLVVTAIWETPVLLFKLARGPRQGQDLLGPGTHGGIYHLSP